MEVEGSATSARPGGLIWNVGWQRGAAARGTLSTTIRDSFLQTPSSTAQDIVSLTPQQTASIVQLYNTPEKAQDPFEPWYEVFEVVWQGQEQRHYAEATPDCGG